MGRAALQPAELPAILTTLLFIANLPGHLFCLLATGMIPQNTVAIAHLCRSKCITLLFRAELLRTYSKLTAQHHGRLRRIQANMDIQEYFNTLSPDLSPKSIRLIHGTFRAALNQGEAWGMHDQNPAVGVKPPRKRAVKPTVLLSLAEIRRMIEGVKEPTKSLIMLIVFASKRPGEALALRWKDILRDRIVIDERVYDDEFDDVKTDAGKREVPFDKHGVILAAVKRMWAANKMFRKPDDPFLPIKSAKRSTGTICFTGMLSR
jgi:integrase